MNKITRHIIFFSALLLYVQAVHAQSGFFVPKAGKIFFTGDTATIFSDVINQGKLGIGKTAVINFNGKQWENDPLSLITDESNNGEGAAGIGGWVRFLSADTTRQLLNGGYNAAVKLGPAFSHLQIQNSRGVQLTGGTAKVRHELKLAEGLLYLNNNILVVGDGNPGAISGYDSSRYIVSGNNSGDGILLRENISSNNGWVVFPIGSKENAYTPAAIRSNSLQGDDFYAGVFDSTRSSVFNGHNMEKESINKTWLIGKRLRPAQDEVDIALQHLVADEGNIFSGNRQHAYIAQYAAGAWDVGNPQVAPVTGYITTASLLTGSGVNARTFNGTISASSYFTKFTGDGSPDTYQTRLWFSAYRTNYQQVRVYWSTRPELNVKYFVVQRRLSNENDFTNRDTIASKAVNGFSNQLLEYTMNDPNNYNGLSYYRLALTAYNGSVSYSNIVVVGATPGGYGLLVWPNPSTGRFFAGISAAGAVKAIVIHNAIGQLIKQEPVNGRSIIEMAVRLPGTYLVSFVSFSGQVLETKKLVVTAY